MGAAEMAIRADPELAAMARGYASNNDKFIQGFAGAWTKLMNADRFKGPVGNVCAST
jgi:catalase (peroxidase I)